MNTRTNIVIDDELIAQAMLRAGSSLEAISDAAVAKGIDPKPRSGRQEYAESVVSRYI